MDLGRRPHDRGAQPPADADPHHAADPHRARGRLRVPLRAVQHRRPGPVPRRHLRRRVGRVVVRRHAEAAARRARDGPRHGGRRGLGGDRRPAEGDGRCPRGDLDDHAQLDRGLGGRLPVPAQRPAAELRPGAAVGAGLQRRRGERQAPGVLGRPGAAGPAHRDLHRARGGRRVLGAAQPLDDRATRCARSASTPRPPATAASASRATTSSSWPCAAPSPGWRARWTSSAGSSTSPPTTSRSRPDRLLRHRGRPARPQHGQRHGGGGAAVRRAAQRHLAAQPRPDDLRARAGLEPDADHPGPRRADRQRRRDRADDAAPRARDLPARHAPRGPAAPAAAGEAEASS